MANTNPNFHALGDINPSRFVILETADFGINEADANEFPIGISQEGAAAAPIPGASALAGSTTYPQLKVYGIGDVCLLELGANATRGQLLKSDADGKGTPIATTGTTAQMVGAIALQSGTGAAAPNPGEKIQVLIVLMHKVYPALS